MIAWLRHHLGIYRHFVATSFAEASSYRLHFVLLIVLDIFFYASTLLTVDFLYRSVAVFGTWDREQFLFFLCFILAVDQLHMTFVSENFWNFADDVRTGNLDFILVRPAAAPVTVFFRHMRPGSLCILPVPWGLMAYYASHIGLPAWAWGAVPLLVMVAFALLVSFEIFISMAIFWVTESYGINFIRMQFQSVSRWPDFAFVTLFRRIFSFILPVLLIGSAPVRFLYDPSEWAGVLGMFFYIGLFSALAAWAWRAGLRRYESASS